MYQKLILLIALSAIVSGCVVSKKKYEAMTARKNTLARQLNEEEARNESLTKKLASATADFESMKTELHKSNALKSDKVNDLLAESEAFKSHVEELKSNLDYAQRQLNSQKASNQENTTEMNTLQRHLRALASDTASLRYTLGMTKERQQAQQLELNATKQQFREAAAKASKLETEITQQNKKVELLEQQLVSKSQTLQDISDSFIELRKDLLSAKANGSALDPNKNKLIDRIARLLGHY